MCSPDFATSLNLPTQAPQEAFNRYVFDNPIDHISNEKFKEVLYKAAAIGLTIIFGSAIVFGVVTLINIAPLSVPLFLILSGTMYKVFHEKVVSYLKQQGNLSKDNAIRYEGMSQEIEKIKQVYVDYTSYHNILRDIGITSTEIPSQDLSEADDDAPYLKTLASLIGRVKYWGKVEEETLEAIQKIDEQIHKLNLKISNDPKAQAEQTKLRMQKQQLQELTLLPAKIANAYVLHVLSNVKDKRDFDAFGQCRPSSYLSHLERQADGAPQPYYFFPETTNTSPLSTKEMIQMTPLQLSKRIFGDSKAFVR